MTETPDLWPDLHAEKINTPKTILSEQAALLGKKTNNLIAAEVVSGKASDGRFVLFFRLNAPLLENYTYELFTLYYSITLLYPCEIQFRYKKISVESEKDLIGKLKEIFNDQETKNILASLYSQSMIEQQKNPYKS